MNGEFEITYLENPAWEVIGGGITNYNAEKTGDDHVKHLCFVLQNAQGEVLGGIIGTTFWNWLYIKLMWLPEDLRGQGYGGQLLALAEEIGRDRGAQYAFLDTFSFQAPGFYQKFGYREFGKLEDFPPGFTRHYLMKDL